VSHQESVELPKSVQVESIISSRYAGHQRPLSWDDRREGIDVVRTGDQRTLRLLSDGGQSPPQPGWTIIISEGNESSGYRWTLYSMPQVAQH
jgi:hypothetical protein